MKNLRSDMIMYEQEYRDFLQLSGVGRNNTIGSSIDSYVSRLRRISRTAGTSITPDTLKSKDDIQRLATAVSRQIRPKSLSDCISAMRKYVAMIELRGFKS